VQDSAWAPEEGWQARRCSEGSGAGGHSSANNGQCHCNGGLLLTARLYNASFPSTIQFCHTSLCYMRANREFTINELQAQVSRCDQARAFVHQRSTSSAYPRGRAHKQITLGLRLLDVAACNNSSSEFETLTCGSIHAQPRARDDPRLCHCSAVTGAVQIGRSRCSLVITVLPMPP